MLTYQVYAVGAAIGFGGLTAQYIAGRIPAIVMGSARKTVNKKPEKFNWPDASRLNRRKGDDQPQRSAQ